MRLRLPRVMGCLVLAGTMALAACSSGTGETGAPTLPSTTVPSSSASSTTPAAAPGATWTAVWPSAATGARYHDPVVVTRSFAVNYLRFANPMVGPVQLGDARSGEVPVRPSAGGPVTTVFVRQLGTDTAWWVLGAATQHIVITDPAALAAIASPVRLRGSSTAFEGTVNVSIRQDNDAQPLLDSYLTGGANGTMGPFDASFPFAQPANAYGAIVLYITSSANGQVLEATTLRVKFAPGGSG